MRLIGVWLVILGLATTLALGLALLAPRPLSDALDQEIGERLHVAAQSATLLLKLSARQWIDTSQRDATDAVLLEAVSEANRGPADLGILHKTVQERLRAFASKAGADLALATDARGRVLGRVGVDEATYKDAIDGLPIVAAALRGLRSDDTYVTDGRLYRLVASPVVSGGGKYIGVLVLGQEIGAQLAQSLHERLDVQAAFLLRGRVMGSSTGWPALVTEPVGVLATAERAHLTAGPTAPMRVGTRHLAVLTALPGQVGDALLAIVGERPAEAGLGPLVAGVLHSDPRAWPLPSLAIVGAGLLAVLLINGILLALSFGKPLRQMVNAAQAVVRGDATRLPDRADAWAPLTRAVNGALEHAEITRAREDRFTPSPPSVSSGSSFAQAPKSAPRPQSHPIVPPDPVRSAPRATAPLFDEPMTVRGRKPVLPSRSAAGLDDDVDEPASIPRLEQTGERFAPSASELMAPELNSGGVLEPLVPTRAPLLGEDEESTTISPGGAMRDDQLSAGDALEDELHEVFAEFVDTKRTCGESVDGLTYEKFATKLRGHRLQLLQKPGCKTVRFQVYIKDGKAALKALPVQ